MTCCREIPEMIRYAVSLAMTCCRVKVARTVCMAMDGNDTADGADGNDWALWWCGL